MTASIDAPALRSKVGEILSSWPTAGLAVGVVSGGSLAWFHGHGVADIEAGTPVDRDTVFRIASVTKTITAVAIMQLWERGLIDLDAPASGYLRAYRLVPASPGFRPVTLRHPAARPRPGDRCRRVRQHRAVQPARRDRTRRQRGPAQPAAAAR